MDNAFTGCKLAYIYDEALLVYKRDNKPGIPFPGLWDLPGGGREGSESPEQCILRELEEEFSIVIPVERLSYRRRVENQQRNGYAYFFVAEGRRAELDAIVFGNEGQYWRMMPIDEYLTHPEAISSLVSRLRDYLPKLSFDPNS